MKIWIYINIRSLLVICILYHNIYLFICICTYSTYFNQYVLFIFTAKVKQTNSVDRSFKPDFVLIRQNLKDAGEDNKNLLLGLMYGGVPSINNLTAIYNFQVWTLRELTTTLKILRIKETIKNFNNFAWKWIC